MVKIQPTAERHRIDASGQTQRWRSASQDQGAAWPKPPAECGAWHSASPAAPGSHELAASGGTYMCESLEDHMPLSCSTCLKRSAHTRGTEAATRSVGPTRLGPTRPVRAYVCCVRFVNTAKLMANVRLCDSALAASLAAAPSAPCWARVCESARQAAARRVHYASAPRARAASISFQQAPAENRAARARRRPCRPRQRPRSLPRWAPQASRRAAAELTCRRRTPLRPPLQAAARLCPPPWGGRGRSDASAKPSCKR